MTSLQIEIDAALERDFSNSRKRKLNIPTSTATSTADAYDENTETDKFIGESTLDVINECLSDEKSEKVIETPSGLKPDLIALCTVSEKEQTQIAGNVN